MGKLLRHPHLHKEKPMPGKKCSMCSRQIVSSLLSEVPVKRDPCCVPSPPAGLSVCLCPPPAGLAVCVPSPPAGLSVCLSHLSSRCCTASHASRRLSSTYIRNRILRQHARLLVSCFRRLGFDLPLNPGNQPHTGQEGTSKAGITSQK